MVDFFTPVRPESDLHPQFLNLRDRPSYAPARGILLELSAEFEDPDGNFVEQFQTTGFDSRTFEIYLFALFKENGFAINRSYPHPDFFLEKNGQTVFVEAVTANPTPSGGPSPYVPIPKDRPPEEQLAYLRHEIPIRFGSPLFSKLQKGYWRLPHVGEHPLIFAIQSFHGDGSLLISSTPLAQYLFGLSHHWYNDSSGKLIISTDPIDDHRLGEKKIPSGFFSQPDAEYISAILFSNSGTAAKFNRIGHEGKYHSDTVRMIRYGTCYRFDPDSDIPAPFVYEVGDGEMNETWREGSVLIHNPHCLHPIASDFIGTGAEERLEEDQIVTTLNEPFFPYSSMTMNFEGDTPTRVLQKTVDKIAAELLQTFPIDSSQ